METFSYRPRNTLARHILLLLLLEDISHASGTTLAMALNELSHLVLPG